MNIAGITAFCSVIMSVSRDPQNVMDKLFYRTFGTDRVSGRAGTDSLAQNDWRSDVSIQNCPSVAAHKFLLSLIACVSQPPHARLTELLKGRVWPPLRMSASLIAWRLCRWRGLPLLGWSKPMTFAAVTNCRHASRDQYVTVDNW